MWDNIFKGIIALVLISGTGGALSIIWSGNESLHSIDKRLGEVIIQLEYTSETLRDHETRIRLLEGLPSEVRK